MDATNQQRAKTVPQLFEAHAARDPNRVALVFQGSSVTYGELNSRANRLASYLTRNGSRKGEFIAICLDRSIEMIVALLGILKAGATYLPLDPEYPSKRLRYMIEHAQASLVISSRNHVERLLLVDTELLLLDEATNTIAKCPDRNISDYAGPDDPFYCIYTSGSTGQPKGVVVPHSAFANHCTWQIEEFSFSKDDTFLQRTSISFDASVWELWTPLVLGARLVVLSSIEQRVPFALVSSMIDNNVTIAQFVPTLLGAVVKIPQFAAIRCRVLFCGGEVLTPALANAVKRVVPCELVNLYGPTEATIDSLYWRVADADDSIAIGRPIRNATVYLLDRHGNQVKEGDAGEIHIGGPCLAIGYRNRPDLTAERFVKDPLSPHGARMYRTGDIGRIRPDGAMEYMGRIDNQLKIRGFRIEPSEIEAALKAIDGVVEAAIVVAADSQGGPALIAYVQPERRTNLDEAVIRASLMEVLPVHMAPHRIILLLRLPLTVAGKIDRETLAHRELGPDPIGEGAITETERVLGEIWASALNRDQVPVNANFFQLGGDSLSATQVIVKVGDRFKKGLTLRHFYENATVQALARLLDGGALSLTGLGSGTTAIRASSNTDSRLVPGLGQVEILSKPDYIPKYLENVTLAYKIEGELDVDALHAAFDTISLRHEELRVTFFENDTGAFYRRVRDPAARAHFVPESTEFDATLSRSPDWVSAEIRRESFTTFDLSAGPLLRYRLIPISMDKEWLLLISVHHVVFDGWSATIIQRELSSAYRSLIQDHGHDLPTLAPSYHDCVAEQRRKWECGSLGGHECYWRRMFESMHFPLTMPWGRARPQSFSYEGDRFEFSIGAQSPAIDEFCHAYSCSPNYLLLAAFFVLFERHTGQRDICVRSPMANRKTSDREEIVGYLVQPSAFRIVLSGELRYIDVVNRLHESSLDIWEHAELPPQYFEACTGVHADRRFASPFQLHFNYQPFSADLMKLDGADVSRLGVPLLGVKTDLSLSISRSLKAFSGTFSFYTGIFCREDMEQFATDYLGIVGEMIAHPDARVLD
ncbi:amino acid adenylation domain-containing protein [Ralstonia nicotianae]|uniref:amino acid adenylation domain-containing protein n=1 Tax=Ralstonia pseudosolanacearum TaxID=1310165 RepID=UPI0020040FCB|nr:amino acid adenylation domain-containing protein [Ralstonia pseudosolanacearum]MCK4120516.1 amino acid adenylation domain-containing protein [Ralstonia pseudosolanacearum]